MFSEHQIPFYNSKINMLQVDHSDVTEDQRVKFYHNILKR